MADKENSLDQYTIETTWSTRLTDDIIMESIQNEPFLTREMESSILGTIAECNTSKYINDKEIFIKLFSFVLKDNSPRPVQAVSVQLGHSAGISYPLDAFHWGWLLLKEARNSGLYSIIPKRDTALGREVYINPCFVLNKQVRDRIDKLQFLPPMKKPPIPWKDNHNGGWVWENKHLVLGSHLNRHDEPLAYDAINKLQSVAWEIDPSTYLFEKDTNEQMNKAQFLKVMEEYMGKHFYFVWRYDKRGRSYSSGYHLNLQNNEYGKALLSLHKKEVITQLPFLYISIANLAGKDKLTWQERVNWVANQDINNIKWEKPMLGRKALRAVADAEQGKPSGYTMSLDATSSGIQIMAVISGCQKTAKYVNCIDPNKRYDLYGEVVKMMNKKLKKKVKRAIIKECTMTHFYNSEARPAALLTDEQLEVFYDVVNGLLPGAEQVMTTINQCWNSKKNHHSWTMPDGHYVYIPVTNDIKGNYIDPEFGKIRLEWESIGSNDDYRSLCPNVIHSIDGYIAREMIRRCNFQLVHVHDCFLFHPNHFLAVKDNYRKIMAEIAKSDLFGNILRQLTGKNSLRVNRKNNMLYTFIENSEYMLS